jgi:endoglucanase
VNLSKLIAGLALASLAAFSQPVYSGKPYQGQPQPIPGRIQAERYDAGGPEVAYHDSDPENRGSGMLNKGDSDLDKFRKDEGVDISYTKVGIDHTLAGEQEKPGELYVGWTVPGEWVRYTVKVMQGGRYVVKAHLSSNNRNAAIGLAFDGVDQTGPIVIPSTGHWHKWRVCDRLAAVTLPAGVHVMTLSFLREGQMNVDYLEFVADSGPVNPFEQTRRLGRGVNIIGYDPLWKDMAQARFHDKHFQLIRDGGFQSVRINLQALAHMDAQNRLSENWFKTLDWAVGQALKNNLMVILDLHEFTNVATDPAGFKPKIVAFWKQVAEHYKDASNDVVFELLNEPNGKLTPKVWNEYLLEPLAAIRASNPTRSVIIGPAFWNGIQALKDFELPENDRNLIVTVHYYLPMTFTHQGAPWSPSTVHLSGVKWGTDDEKNRVRTDLMIAQEWSKAHDRPIYLGEFGAYDKADMDSRALYTAAVARTAESFGWAWGYWQFDSDFIVYDIDHDHWIEPIWKALVP